MKLLKISVLQNRKNVRNQATLFNLKFYKSTPLQRQVIGNLIRRTLIKEFFNCNLFKGIKITEIKAFIARENGSYHLFHQHSNFEEISDSLDDLSYTLKNLRFKKVNKKKGFNSIARIKLTKSQVVKVNDIIIPENIISLQPDKILFTLSSKKLNIIMLLKLVL
uniref:RNA polymerase alpha subunit n=1 Tax=Colacium vesiculosum TaxID=102910 RepID=A0A0B5HUR7_9EUGL|nr:RNA polymerase alpha subunit [Colacium vesiculosum]